MEAETIEALHDLVRAHKYSKTDYLRAYLTVIQNHSAGYGASERFLVGRLEGLEQVISAN
jgi:hypothetical protein